MACNTGQKYDATVNYYLAYHQDLKWIPANSSTLSSIPNQISHNYGSFQLRYGRILVNNFYVLGKINFIKKSPEM
jgi:hypothetical protein